MNNSRLCKTCGKNTYNSWANYCRKCAGTDSIKKPEYLNRNNGINPGRSYAEYKKLKPIKKSDYERPCV